MNQFQACFDQPVQERVARKLKKARQNEKKREKQRSKRKATRQQKNGLSISPDTSDRMAGLCINNRDSAPALPLWGLL
jgi:hypothetical protein